MRTSHFFVWIPNFVYLVRFCNDLQTYPEHFQPQQRGAQIASRLLVSKPVSSRGYNRQPIESHFTVIKSAEATVLNPRCSIIYSSVVPSLAVDVLE